MADPVRTVTLVGRILEAALKLERDDEGRVERVNLFKVLPLYDRKRGERRRARRAARAARRERDAR
jgi:hypothetical protein